LMGLAYYLELVLWFNAVRQIDVSVASSITVPAPAVTMLFAWLLLGEEIHAFQLLALGLVGIGLLGLLGAGFRARSPAGALRRGEARGSRARTAYSSSGWILCQRSFRPCIAFSKPRLARSH